MVQLPQELPEGANAMGQIVGYEVGPFDVLACGICLFIFAYRVPPWNFAVSSDASFRFLKSQGDQGFHQLLRHWRKELMSPEAMKLMTSMLRIDPMKRPTIDECLAHPWFAAYEGTVPETHPPL